MMRIVLIRHAKTYGNLAKRYIGRIDESLCREGKEALKQRIREGHYPAAEENSLLFVSPMKRCRQTAALIYPGKEQLVVEDFRECDFGEFEYKNHVEMLADPSYQQWIDSGGTGRFPGGEDPEAFRIRSVNAFRKIRKMHADCPQMILVAHGGTLMSLLSVLGIPQAGYFERCVDNGHGYDCEALEEDRIRILRQI